jgi:hypothetical protein
MAADGDEEVRAIAAEDQIAGPVAAAMTQRATRCHQFCRASRPGLTRPVGDAPDRARAADIQISVVQGEAMRTIQARDEDRVNVGFKSSQYVGAKTSQLRLI